jgi:hypothetical protein
VATIDVGQPGDRLFVRSVHGDERADGRSYRWTQARSWIEAPGLGGAERLQVSLAVQAGRPDGRAVPLTVLIDGVEAGTAEVGAATTVAFEVARPEPARDTAVIELRAPTFRPPGDARDLGVILDSVTVEPLVTSWSARAFVWRLAPLLLLAALAGAALWPLRRWVPTALLVLVGGGLVVVLALIARVWMLSGWSWLAAGLAAAALVVHHRPALDHVAVAALALDRARLAWAALGLVVAVYVAAMTALAAEIEWIGHADYADNAVVARNLIAGRGYTVDYVAQFYLDYPRTIRHPADVWPLLQPTLIAGSFLLFGVSTFAAKLPNIALMAGMIVATFWLGQRLFGHLAGLIAALLLALDVYFFQNALFPLNDIVFALLALLTIALPEALADREQVGRRSLWLYVATGVCAGLLFIAKPSGALLALGTAAWWLWQRRPGGSLPWPGWRYPLIGAAVAVLVVLPLFGRNLAVFGQPFFTTERYDAWVLKWEPPDENIYRLMGDDLPHPRRLVGFGFDRVTEAVARQFQAFWEQVSGGVLLEPVLLVVAVGGLLIGGGRVRRQYTGLAWAVVPYALFVLVYWHYEQRYFMFLVPWALALVGGAAAGLFWHVTERCGPAARRLAVVGLVLGAALLLTPRVQQMSELTSLLTPPAGDVVVGEWLAANTAQEAVVMTRVPWQISWHSQRRAVMIPLAPAEDIFATMREYGVTHLLIEGLNKRATRREALAPLYQGQEAFGLTKIKAFTNDRGEPYAYLYAVPPNIGARP